MKATIIGYGSIGKRHAENLKSLGHEVVILDVVQKSLNQAKLDGYMICNTIDEALKYKIDFVMICTPTESHIQNAISFATEGIHVFVEKPISYNMNGIDTLLNICKEKNVKLMVAENLRFNRGIELMKTLLNNNSIGKVFACNYFYGQYLPNWRPNADYKLSYSSSEYGGIINDDCHAIALMLDFFKSVDKSIGMLCNTKVLGIKQEDIADYILYHKNGVISHIHSNYLSHFYIRTLEVFGLEGVIQWDYVMQQINLRTKSLDTWRTFDCSCDDNDMYIKEIQYYISCITDNIEPYHNGIETIKIIDTLKKQNLDV